MGKMTLAALPVAKGPMQAELCLLTGCLLMARQTEWPFVSSHQVGRLRDMRLVAQKTFPLAGRGVGHHQPLPPALGMAGETDCLFSALEQGLSL